VPPAGLGSFKLIADSLLSDLLQGVEKEGDFGLGGVGGVGAVDDVGVYVPGKTGLL